VSGAAWDSFLMVDWSSGGDTGSTPRKDAVWTALRREACETRYHRNREVAEAYIAEVLASEIAAGRRVLVGFDFPFGYPAGFADRVVEGPKRNNRFDLAGELNGLFPGIGPFWFNGYSDDVVGLPRKGTARDGHGMAERRLADAQAKGAFTVWQMGGAGAVGGQVMTGMAALSRLRARFGGDLAVWPFEVAEAPVLVTEIWPSLLNEFVKGREGIRDEVQVRLVADTLAEMQAAGTLQAALDAVPEAARVEEGWILGLGAEAQLKAAARAALRPDLMPPRLKDDCFALPPGVDWMPVDQALALLKARIGPVCSVERASPALDRILAEQAVARRANPPAANSAVDGYGFAHAVTGPGRMVLPLVQGRAAAGAPFAGRVPEGRAVRILTGGLAARGGGLAWCCRRTWPFRTGMWCSRGR